MNRYQGLFHLTVLRNKQIYLKMPVNNSKPLQKFLDLFISPEEPHTNMKKVLPQDIDHQDQNDDCLENSNTQIVYYDNSADKRALHCI